MSIAICSGSLRIVHYLVEGRGIPVNSGYRDSWIDEAIWWAQPDLVAFLLEKGVDVYQVENSTSPLHTAGMRDNPQLARLLCADFQARGCLDDAFRSTASCNDLTPLSNAIALKAYRVAQEYIAFGAVPDGTIGGLPALHVALWPKSGYTPMSLLRHLIGKCPLDIVNTRLDGLMNPVEIAVSSGNLPAIYFLLIAGANIDNSAPTTAWKMLQAAENRKSEIDKTPIIDETGPEITEDDEETYYHVRQLINFVIHRRLILRRKSHGVSAVRNEVVERLALEEELEEHLPEEFEMLPRYFVDKVWSFGRTIHQFVIPP